jgi:uncharacterized cupin superfamily protein
MDASRTSGGLPANLIRPSASAWQEGWGDRALPAGYGGRYCELGEPLGLVDLGANLTALPPGARACPLHHHLIEEELFFVLEGELTVRELAPGAQRYTEYALRAGEMVVYPPGTGLAHQSINRSAAEVLYLSLSDTRAAHEVCVYPDSGKTLARGLRTIGVFGDGSEGSTLEAARAAARGRGVDALGLDGRPRHVQGPDTVAERALGEGVHGRPMARAGGATRVLLNRDRLQPGAVSGPLHWHTAEDELLVVLSGSPTLRQWRPHDGSSVEERAVLQPGDVVGWPAGGEVAHQLRCEGATDAVVIVVGTDRPGDVIVLPELDRIRIRALERTGTLRATDYWAGEQLE